MVDSTVSEREEIHGAAGGQAKRRCWCGVWGVVECAATGISGDECAWSEPPRGTLECAWQHEAETCR